jgi:enoyl-CoA hydratase
MSGDVRWEVSGGVAVVTLDNPGRRNAIDASLTAALVRACDAIDADVSVGAVVLRGSGGYFCSGGDRDELAAISAAPVSEAGMAATQRIYDAFLRVGRLAVPTVAAVRGGAVGAGINLALATDVRVVARDAVLASGFTALGVHPGGGHFALLNRFAGPQTATVLGVLGEAVDGDRAVRLGLAYDSVADDEVEPVALRLVAAAGRDPGLARATIRSLRTETGPPALSWQAAVAVEQSVQPWSFARKGAGGWRARGERADGRP